MCALEVLQGERRTCAMHNELPLPVSEVIVHSSFILWTQSKSALRAPSYFHSNAFQSADQVHCIKHSITALQRALCCDFPTM